jgi:hypothetical protein
MTDLQRSWGTARACQRIGSARGLHSAATSVRITSASAVIEREEVQPELQPAPEIMRQPQLCWRISVRGSAATW